jgi:hypothetical protein
MDKYQTLDEQSAAHDALVAAEAAVNRERDELAAAVERLERLRSEYNRRRDSRWDVGGVEFRG